MLFIAMIWMIFIFIATCTKDVTAFLERFEVSFIFELTPTWHHFTFISPLEQTSTFEMSGHFFMFFFLTLLLAASIKLRTALFIGTIYSFLTEYLQLHFGRGAELYDLVANGVGIVFAGTLVGLYKWVDRKEKMRYRRTA